MRSFKCPAPSTTARAAGEGLGGPCGWATADLGMAEKLGVSSGGCTCPWQSTCEFRQFTTTQKRYTPVSSMHKSGLHKGPQGPQGHTQGSWSHAAVSGVPNSHKTHTDLRGINAQSHTQQSDTAWDLQASRMHADHL